MALEKDLERKLRQRVEAKGGTALKLTGVVGLPDRIILLPGGKIGFAELKTTQGTTTARQEYMLDRLHRMGFIARVVRTEQDAQNLVEEVQKR